MQKVSAIVGRGLDTPQHSLFWAELNAKKARGWWAPNERQASVECHDGLRPGSPTQRDKCPLCAKMARGWCVTISVPRWRGVGVSPTEEQDAHCVPRWLNTGVSLEQVSVVCQDGLWPGCPQQARIYESRNVEIATKFRPKKHQTLSTREKEKEKQ